MPVPPGKNNGFGFTTGEVAGVISVTVPSRSVWTMALETVSYVEVILVILTFLFSFLFIRREVIQPIAWITTVTEELANGEHLAMDLPDNAANSKNEMLQLSASVNRLQSSL